MAKKHMETEPIEIRAIIEVLGRPKEHVESTIHKYVDQIKKDDAFNVTDVDFALTEPQESMFSTFCEIEFSVMSFEDIITFCFDYMPSSIEIVSPDQLILPQRLLSNMLNDLQAKLHRLDMLVKKREADNKALSQKATALLRNVIMLSLKQGGKTIKQLAMHSGVDEQQLLPFLGAYIEEGKIRKDGNMYRSAKE